MATPRQMHVIGFGAVGQAFQRLLSRALVVQPTALAGITRIHVWAPEITAAREEGLFAFHPCPPVTRATLVGVVDGFGLRAGDIVVELATRVDTVTMWAEVKGRGAHFLNTGFDVWPDVELDLNLLDDLKKHASFKAGAGRTCVFSFGCNPGIASHFVRHGLRAVTGCTDMKAAAAAFGLRAIIFSERDTQWPVRGSKEEKLIEDTQTTVLYNTWSPGNYIVETVESTILYAGCPEAATKINAAGPAITSWTPVGPILGFAAPHDECFTVQPWFEKEVPALFIYEAPATARNYVKGGKGESSDKATCKLFTPATYNLAGKGADVLGSLLLSDKPGQAPVWSGIAMNVDDAREIDPTGAAGPTALQVTGGLFSALQYVLAHPESGDCFPEDVPTEFVYSRAFPWSGAPAVFEAPQALAVAGFFDPASPGALEAIIHGQPAAGRTHTGPSPLHGTGTFATVALPAASCLAQLTVDGRTPLADAPFNHAPTGSANAYVDRNRAVRTLAPVAAGAEITLDYNLLHGAADAAVKFVASPATPGGAAPVTNWAAVPTPALERLLLTAPIEAWLEAEIMANTKLTTVSSGPVVVA